MQEQLSWRMCVRAPACKPIAPIAAARWPHCHSPHTPPSVWPVDSSGSMLQSTSGCPSRCCSTQVRVGRAQSPHSDPTPAASHGREGGVRAHSQSPSARGGRRGRLWLVGRVGACGSPRSTRRHAGVLLRRWRALAAAAQAPRRFDTPRARLRRVAADACGPRGAAAAGTCRRSSQS